MRFAIFGSALLIIVAACAEAPVSAQDISTIDIGTRAREIRATQTGDHVVVLGADWDLVFVDTVNKTVSRKPGMFSAGHRLAIGPNNLYIAHLDERKLEVVPLNDINASTFLPCPHDWILEGSKLLVIADQLLCLDSNGYRLELPDLKAPPKWKRLREPSEDLGPFRDSRIAGVGWMIDGIIFDQQLEKPLLYCPRGGYQDWSDDNTPTNGQNIVDELARIVSADYPLLVVLDFVNEAVVVKLLEAGGGEPAPATQRDSSTNKLLATYDLGAFEAVSEPNSEGRNVSNSRRGLQK